MSRWNSAIEVTFNDNDGRVGWRCNPVQAYDIARHQKIFGKWRTRWILLKQFWRGLMWIEKYTADRYASKSYPLWIFKSEIPE